MATTAPTTSVRHLCPTCHRTVDGFVPGGRNDRPKARCPRCSAKERHRFLAILLEGLAPVLTGAADVLDVAPSPFVTRLVERVGPRRYVALDLDRDRPHVSVQASATRMPFATATFDLVLCFHVFEHIPDDRSAMAELVRVLRPGGVAIAQVPFRESQPTEEDPDAPVDERIRRFGQADHVRLYGHDFERRLEEAGCSGVRITPGDVLSDELLTAFGLDRRRDDPYWLLRRADSEPRVVRHHAPGNGLLSSLSGLPPLGEGGAGTGDGDPRMDRIARLEEERDALRAQRDVWRTRHERITGHPLVRVVAAPYRWWQRRTS